MSRIAQSTLLGFALFGAIGAFSISAEAQPLHHVLHHAYGAYVNPGFAEPVDYQPSRRAWIGGARDDDSGNAKNPALPWYARGRGQETGGPARMLIGQ